MEWFCDQPLTPSIVGNAPFEVAVSVAPNPSVPLLYVAERFAVVAALADGFVLIPAATSSTYPLVAKSLDVLPGVCNCN